MTANSLVKALQDVTEGQAFITASQLARAFGRTDQAKVRKAYLSGLEAIDGKYYLVRDVAAVLQKRSRL